MRLVQGLNSIVILSLQISAALAAPEPSPIEIGNNQNIPGYDFVNSPYLVHAQPCWAKEDGKFVVQDPTNIVIFGPSQTSLHLPTLDLPIQYNVSQEEPTGTFNLDFVDLSEGLVQRQSLISNQPHGKLIPSIANYVLGHIAFGATQEPNQQHGFFVININDSAEMLCVLVQRDFGIGGTVIGNSDDPNYWGRGIDTTPNRSVSGPQVDDILSTLSTPFSFGAAGCQSSLQPSKHYLSLDVLFFGIAMGLLTFRRRYSARS